MRNFFKIPKTDYEDFYDQAKFRLLWNLSLVFTILITVLSAVNLSNEAYAPTSYIAAWILSSSSLFILYKTRKYKIISIAVSLFGLAIVSYTFLELKNVLNYTTPMWVVVDVIFTFFMLGRRWGWIIGGINFLVIGIYFFQNFQSNLEAIPVYTDLDVLYFVIEYTMAGLFMAYILHMFVVSTQHAERGFRISNDRLNNQNRLVIKQNEEKEFMLKEIHHRVKNNLQVITSLLRLQSYEIDDDKSVSKFNESIARINAMALIHEKLYQREMMENFELENYVTSLSEELLQTYAISREVRFMVSSQMKKVGNRTIVPLALLLNELISNSLKHAFAGVSKPKIRIVITKQGSYKFKLSYFDNGQWKDNDKPSFGKDLIEAMTEQLDGTVKLVTNYEGSVYTFNLNDLREKYDESSLN